MHIGAESIAQLVVCMFEAIKESHWKEQLKEKNGWKIRVTSSFKNHIDDLVCMSNAFGCYQRYLDIRVT